MSPTASAPWALALAEWHQVCKFVLGLHALLHAFVLGLVWLIPVVLRLHM